MTVATIGNFDGIHLGHKELFKRTLERAKEKGLEPCVITFEPHPLKILEKNIKLITPYDKKKLLIKRCGIDRIEVIPFTREFSRMEPEEFVRRYLVEKFGVKHLVVGFNYTFGRDGKGDVELLKKLGEKYGFTVEVVPPKMVDGEVVSSTRIRRLIEKGEIEKANKLLGREFFIHGRVVEGKGLGRKIGFPTANVETMQELLPPIGVYPSYVELNGKRYKGVANIGTCPTFCGDKLTIEVHILDFDRDIYGEEIAIIPKKRIREEKRFSSVSELIEQIKKDVEEAKCIL